MESIVFYPVLAPLFLAAGYDLMVPLAIVFGGCTIGFIASFSNPFSVIIASNTIGINWFEGFYGRVAYFAITTAAFIWYLTHYSDKVKKDPTASIVYKVDGISSSKTVQTETRTEKTELSLKTKALLVLFGLTFTAMIVGIIFFDWWTTEMSALFFTSAIIVA